MTEHHVWDRFLRVFHWSTAGLFLLNTLLTDPESALHIWIGYAVGTLVVLRLIWGLIGPKTARFHSFAPRRRTLRRQLMDMATGRKSAHLGHSPLGALMIFNLIAVLIGISASGYMMTTSLFWGVDWVESLHEALVTWAEISVVVHVAAVLWESRRTGINLARAMVTGVKTVPDTVRLEP
ncbi:cytochrome b/b6 domain-containing protein [Mameliella sediminis]|uniref:cytochrome b/b6 domain-containing protein n=1 Tax=Mameliella sediminis TaxID=2836866 RepID=UPI001C4968BD|nr:cytochrome b/b6 domain-containing protein [Mameliella sediminis]MBV7392930.1 cytochrome b/b6 domain-containing protein [Mameliella sediminis]